MSDDQTKEDPENHTKKKWYDYKPTKGGSAIAALIIYGIFIFADIEIWWPHSHLASSIVGVTATIALIYYEMFAQHVVDFGRFVLTLRTRTRS